MTRTHGWRLAAAAAAGLLAARGAAAQAPAPAAGAGPRAGCTYDTCALRRERVFFSERLYAGNPGRIVARPRGFGAFKLDSIVRGVPEAETHARIYQREQVRGGVLSAVGGILALVAVVDAINRSGSCTVVGVGGAATCTERGTARATALAVGSVGLNLAAAWRYQKADRAANRAVWFFNRALAR